ncbi:MAG: serine/threonine-protein kinase [Acidobacteria bacterium]|nr:serine/threonine-protein kinase [Acidobacteriota bacterium]
MIGQTIGHYQITAKLGEGGMGEVFRAADTRLNREVALKVLPQAFASDPQRMGRFQREAQLLASLNHPNIAAIYGLEEAVGVRALVLELVEGPTLADRIAAGPLPVEEAAAIARQMAEALESAHDRSIIHRDLKPSNVKVTLDGAVKLLDFGLAKAMEDEPASSDLATSPTLTAAATRAGIILGTAAYMSPEQAKGKRVDRRADIWAFGVVLFEMLAGKPMFSGETASEVMAAVILKETDWQRLPASTPAPILALLRRCLDRDPRRRLRDIGEARLILEDYLANPTAAAAPASLPAQAAPLPLWKRALPWAAAGVFAVALALVLWQPWKPPTQPPALARLSIELGAEAPVQTPFGSAVVLSPDGTWMAYAGRKANEPPQVFVRSLDQLEATPLAGTEGARDLFFSPDGQWIAFFADNKLKKAAVSGGGTITLCDTPNSRGGWWGEDGTIILAADSRHPLVKVSAAGGSPEPLTQLDAKRSELTHRWPQVLPGGRAVLFTAHNAGTSFDQSHIQVQSLVTGEKKTIHQGGSYARFIPDPVAGGARGYLVFARQSALFAAPFDLKRLEMIGQPAPFLERVATTMGTGGAQFAFSYTGAFLYLPGDDSSASASLSWMDAQGRFQPLRAAGANYLEPRFSPDGTRLAMEINEAGTSDIWVYDWRRDTLTRLTFAPSGARCRRPVWTRDGLRIAYDCDRPDAPGICWKRSDGAGDEQLLLASKLPVAAFSWSADGKTLAFTQEDPKTTGDIWTLPVEGDERSGWKPGQPRPFLVTPFFESGAAFSPDGRWLAYHSNESGNSQIYVRPFPGPGGKWQVSAEGGFHATWSRNTRELFFKSPDEKIMVATWTASGDSFRAEKPRLWSEGQLTNRGFNRNFDLHPDGKRFAVLRAPEGTEAAGPSRALLILNVQRDLRRLAPSQ